MRAARNSRILRTIPFVFALCLVSFPTQAKYGGGMGELNDPYLIYTAEQMNAIGAEPNDWDKHFMLMADIDLAGYSYDAALIAPDVDPCDLAFQGTSFTGILDGSGHVILNLTIVGEYYLGLFGRLEYGAEIKNLGVVDVNITGSDYIGGFVGFSKGNIATCYCTGMVNGNRFVGGLTGRNWGTITASYSTAAVTGNDDVGGLAAGNYGRITNSYNTGAVTANWDAGGLVGANSGSISTSYSTGTVSEENRAGGLVGYNLPDIGIVSGFWDVETSGLASSDGGIGKTTDEMQTADTFIEAGWDFVDETANGTDDIWWILEGRDYPRLWWELEVDSSYGGGSGEPNDPYLIYTVEQFNAIGAVLDDWDKHFQLMEDIDLAGCSYDSAPIAPDTNDIEGGFQGAFFTGTLDGNNNTIINLTIVGENYVGLFGQLETGAEIKNLGVVDVNIIGTDYVGGIVGFSKGSIATSYCTGTVSGDKRVGGLAGRNWRTITASYSTATVIGNSDAGGLAANNYGSITNCYSTSAVTSYWDAGGLVGENYGTIATSYSTGMVSGDSRPGGLVAYNWEDAVITSSFWDVETSGQSSSHGGTAMTTVEMQTVSTFLNTGWDFVDETADGTEDIWWIDEGRDYPILWWELTEAGNN